MRTSCVATHSGVAAFAMMLFEFRAGREKSFMVTSPLARGHHVRSWPRAKRACTLAVSLSPEKGGREMPVVCLVACGGRHVWAVDTPPA